MPEAPNFRTLIAHLVAARCVGSGAYVLDITTTAAYFDGVIDTLGIPRLFGHTHAGFSRRYVQLDPLQYDIPIQPHISVPCDGQPTKRVALVYRFEHAGRRYLYLKLERHPATSAKHIRDAIRRYILRSRDPFATRRESDAARTHNIQANAAVFGSEAWGGSVPRLGNEIFVPSAYVERLVWG